MLASELREKPSSKLLEMEKSLAADILNLRFQLATEQLKDTVKVQKTKKDLARVKTVLRERALGIRGSQDPGQDLGQDDQEGQEDEEA